MTTRAFSLFPMALMVLLSASACSKKPCAPNGPVEGNPKWAAHPDLLPPGGHLCGTTSEEGWATVERATVDYETSSDPVDRLTAHLLSKGYILKEDKENGTGRSIAYDRGKEAAIIVRTSDEGKWMRLMVEHTLFKKR